MNKFLRFLIAAGLLFWLSHWLFNRHCDLTDLIGYNAITNVTAFASKYFFETGLVVVFWLIFFRNRT